MSGELFAVRWVTADDGGPVVRLLDQTRLPGEHVVVDCREPAELAEAIRSLRVRGAPALGVAGAYGVVLAGELALDIERAAEELAGQRPTAVNLAWAAHRVAKAGPDRDAMLTAARAIEDDNAAACRAMGRHGADLLARRMGRGEASGHAGRDRLAVLTHCNTGMLACQGIGTAFGVARTLHEDGRLQRLWIDETRPLLQGARLTAFEAGQLGMPHAVLVDAAAGALLARGEVDAVVVGADRIAANGDTANKVGTYALAVVAARQGVPVVVVAPSSTVDLATPDGASIDIEERDADEVRRVAGEVAITPAVTPAVNPAFDVTPAELITAVITEHGAAPPQRVAALLRR